MATTERQAQIDAERTAQQAKKVKRKESVAQKRAATGLTPITTEMRKPGESVTALQERGKEQAQQFAGDFLKTDAGIAAQEAAQRRINEAETKAQETQAALDQEKAQQTTSKKMDFFNQEELSTEAKRLTPTQFTSETNFKNVIGSDQFASSALDAFKQSNPQLDIDYANTALQRRVDRELIRAKEKGTDPTEAIEKLFEDPRFQVTATKTPDVTISDKVETSDGVVDTNASLTTDVNTVYSDYVGSDMSASLDGILSNPEAYADMNSGDWISQMLQLTVGVTKQNLADSLKSIGEMSAQINIFQENSTATLLKRETEDINYLNKAQDVADLRLELEQNKLQAAEDNTMRPLREKQARLEGYLKAKFNYMGMSESASGLSLMMSQITAYDRMVENTQLGFTNAALELSVSHEELMLGYAGKVLDVKRNTDAQIADIDAKVLDTRLQLESDKLNTTSAARVKIAESIGQAMTQKAAAEEAAKQEQIELWKFTQGQQLEMLKLAQKDTESELQKSQRLKIDAEARKLNLDNAKKNRSNDGGANNGVPGQSPLEFLSGVFFGGGASGDSITDSEGNVLGRITSPFGANHSAISGEKTHNGVDMVFENGDVKALSSGTIIEKGYSEGAYGAYVWMQDNSSGKIFQYGHLNASDVDGLEIGSTYEAGDVFSRHETDPSLWGSSTGAHTDLRLVGQQDNKANNITQEYGYAILDGRQNLSNITGATPEETAQLRADTTIFVNQKLREGYRSKYPVLTETQLALVNQISDDLNGNKAFANMLDIRNGSNTVNAIFGTEEKIANATGFDDIAAINSFQRMVDPGATVREGDVTLLQSAVPFLKRVDPSYKWSQFTKGDKLPEGVRKSLVRVANEIYTQKANTYNSTIGARFKARALNANVPFNLIGEDFIVDVPVDPALAAELDRPIGPLLESGEFFSQNPFDVFTQQESPESILNLYN